MKTPAILLMVLCALRAANAQEIMEPADKPITMTGALRQLHGYGPPGWGETRKIDSRFTYLVIKLAKPVNIPCTSERPEWKLVECRSTKELELFFSSDSADELELKAKKLIGRKVLVTGMLQRQIAPAEMTAIYIEVTAIQTSTGGPTGNLP